jgi:hypothetical protein
MYIQGRDEKGLGQCLIRNFMNMLMNHVDPIKPMNLLT